MAYKICLSHIYAKPKNYKEPMFFDIDKDGWAPTNIDEPEDGEVQISIEEALHDKLMREADFNKYPLINRMDDYRDIGYSKSEVRRLIDEYELLISESKSQEIIELLKSLWNICAKAKERVR